MPARKSEDGHLMTQLNLQKMHITKNIYIYISYIYTYLEEEGRSKNSKIDLAFEMVNS